MWVNLIHYIQWNNFLNKMDRGIFKFISFEKKLDHKDAKFHLSRKNRKASYVYHESEWREKTND